MTNTQKKTQSYASIVQNDQFPTKEQAIIIDSVDGAPISEYIAAIGEIIPPSDIRFVSRISNNRVCIYLATSERANQLVENKTTIKISNQILEVKPLISKLKRIIISNVCPVIPHVVIEESLKNLRIKPESPITFLRAGLSEPGYAHILSFRRQVYIHPDDLDKIPESIPVDFEETRYWIYPTTDNIACFICKKQGHLAKHCPVNENKTLSSNTSQNNLSSNLPNVNIPMSTPQTSPTIAATSQQPKESQTGNTLIKRPLSTGSSVSTQDATPEMTQNDDKPKDHQIQRRTRNDTVAKKSKLSHADQLEEDLAPVKDFLSDPDNKQPMNFHQLKCFLETTKGAENINEIALEYNKDLSIITDLLTRVYPFLKSRALKNRITRLKNKLQKNNEDNIEISQKNEDLEFSDDNSVISSSSDTY